MIAPNEPNDPQLPEKPKPNGGNGRNTLGRFEKGNPGGPGCAISAAQQKYNYAITQATSAEEVVEVFRKLMEIALEETGGPDWRFAVREVLDRLLGKATENVKLDASFTMNVVNYFREVAERARATG